MTGCIYFHLFPSFSFFFLSGSLSNAIGHIPVKKNILPPIYVLDFYGFQYIYMFFVKNEEHNTMTFENINERHEK